MDDAIEMFTGTLDDTTVSVVEDPGCDIEEVPNNNRKMEGVSPNTEVMRKVAHDLMSLDLDLACTSDKLANMNLFMMHVAEREGDFEAFASAKEGTLDGSVVKALEFDTLSGIFYSEITEMDKFVLLLESEAKGASKIISALGLGESCMEIEDKLRELEKSIILSQEQVSELTIQSRKFQRILSKFNGEEIIEEKEVAILESCDSLGTSANVKMETSEQQRNILRTLEKSLARELDLDNKLTECTQAIEEMRLRQRSLEQEILSMEEETATIYARFLEADSASAVFMGISKDLMGKLQSCQLIINSASRRENELSTRLQNSMQSVERLQKEEVDLQEKVNSLEEKLNDSESTLLSQNASLDGNNEKLKELEEKVVIAEIRAEKAEGQCKLLAETNKGLTEEIDCLKDSCGKQLKETNVQLQEAMDSVDASQEQQNMLYTSINDMNVLIENLKSKTSEAVARADCTEDKLIILSETNAELNDELNFLRSKLKCLETSLQRAGETKLATAKDIDIQTQMITDLIMQLAIERERLHKQMSFLIEENRALVDKLHMPNKVASDFVRRDNEKNAEIPSSKYRVDSVVTGKRDNTVSVSAEVESKLETVRSIDPGRLNIKYVLSAIVAAVIAVLAACFFWPQNCPF